MSLFIFGWEEKKNDGNVSQKKKDTYGTKGMMTKTFFFFKEKEPVERIPERETSLFTKIYSQRMLRCKEEEKRKNEEDTAFPVTTLHTKQKN